MKHGYIRFTEPELGQRVKQQMHKWCKAGFLLGVDAKRLKVDMEIMKVDGLRHPEK